MSRATGPARPFFRFLAASTATSLTLDGVFILTTHHVFQQCLQNDNHLGENVGQAGVVLFRDLVEDSEHSKTIGLDEVVVGWSAVLVEVLGVDVHEVDLDRELLPVQSVLRPLRAVGAPVPVQLQEVEPGNLIFLIKYCRNEKDLI